MFQKRIIELFVVLIYWVVLIPNVYNYCANQKYIVTFSESPLAAIPSNATFALSVTLIFFIFYRIVMFIYTRIKLCEIQMWHNMEKIKENPELQCKAEDKSHHKEAPPKENLDCVDTATAMTPNFIRTISNPPLAESKVAQIHTKHDEHPLKTFTLPREQVENHYVVCSPTPRRSAPPVPQTPGWANNLSSSVIMEPNALRSNSQHQFSPV